jgi:hypothetical protein
MFFYLGPAGKVYVYKRARFGYWSLQQNFTTPTTTVKRDGFGQSVAYDINNSSRMIIGNGFVGAAYIFQDGPSTGWSQIQYLKFGGSNIPNKEFGTNVGLTTMNAFVSAPVLNTLYVYTQSTSTTYTQQMTLLIPNPVVFACSFIVLDIDTIAVANCDSSYESKFAGVYIFKYQSTSMMFSNQNFLGGNVSQSSGQLPICALTNPTYEIMIGSGTNFTQSPCKIVILLILV